MGKLIATGRHGAHSNNVLTTAGQGEVDTSARWLLDLCKKDGILTVTLVTSEEPRARESGARYQAILVEGGLTVNVLPADSRLNPASGLGAIAKGIPEKGIPAYGQGMIGWWFTATDRKKLPEGIDVESYYSVANRVRISLQEKNPEDPNNMLLAVFHGGSIEPGIVEMLALTNDLDDLPCGALVVSNLDDMNYEVFNPNTGSVITGN